MNHAARAVILLAAGIALRDCLLLATGLLVWGLHQQQRLDDCPDRAHAWLRCVLGGTALLAAGALLAAHTASVFFGWWPANRIFDIFVSAALALVVAVGGLAPTQLTQRHALIAVGVLASALSRQPWAACAFAAFAALYALMDGARRLGPQSHALAAPHNDR